MRESTIHCLRLANPTIDHEQAQDVQENAEHEPCRIHCCDIRLRVSVSNASKNLKDRGLKHMFDGEVRLAEVPEPPPTCGLTKAAAKIKSLMLKLNYRLYRGMVYQKPEKGRFSFTIFYQSFKSK